MPAVARYTGAHITLRTTLSPRELLDVCAAIARTKPPLRNRGSDRIEVTERRDGAMRLAVRSILGKTWLTFQVDVHSDGVSTLKTRIVEFGWTQETVFLIPIETKQIAGYYLYKHFMESLARTVRERDRQASVEIVERTR